MASDIADFFDDLVDKGKEIVGSLSSKGGDKAKDLIKKGMEIFTGFLGGGGSKEGGKTGSSSPPPPSGGSPPPPTGGGGFSMSGIANWAKANPLLAGICVFVLGWLGYKALKPKGRK